MTSETTKTRDMEEVVDIESFVEAESNEDQVTETGIARLVSVDRISSYDEIPEYYKYHHTEDEDDVLLFKAIKQGSEAEEIKIPVSESDESTDWEMIKSWTGKDDVTSLAGQTVPIRDLSDGDYKIETFVGNSFLRGYSASQIKNIFEMGAIEYEDGEWRKSHKMKRQDEILSSVEKVTEFGFFASLIGMFMLSSSSLVLLFSVLAVCSFMISGLASSRSKPIEPLMDRI